jgi:alpha-beta hydrolase superfamily lysophospholipase
VAALRRVLVRQDGPVVLVGHSYGGAVITAAGAGESNVKKTGMPARTAPHTPKQTRVKIYSPKISEARHTSNW